MVLELVFVKAPWLFPVVWQDRARAHAADDKTRAQAKHGCGCHQQRPAQRAQRMQKLVRGALEVITPRDGVECQHEGPYAGVALELEAHVGVTRQHALVGLIPADSQHLGVLFQLGDLPFRQYITEGPEDHNFLNQKRATTCFIYSECMCKNRSMQITPANATVNNARIGVKKLRVMGRCAGSQTRVI